MRELKKNEWNNLMGYIAARNTVLLIGDNLTIVKNTESNVFQTLIEYISTKLYDFVVNYYTNKWEEQNYTKEKINEEIKKLNLPTNKMVMDMSWCNFSEAFEDTDEGSVDFYIKKIIDEIPDENLNYEKIEKLLSLDRFNVILSSSYSSDYKKIVEKYAKDMGRDFVHGVLDNGTLRLDPISKWRGENTQILFIDLMGHHEVSTRSLNRLAVTEEDMILFVMSWISIFSRSTHQELKKCLDDYFLLVLGCNVPSWAFRFIWYVIKNPSGKKGNNLKSVSLRPTPWNSNVHNFITKYKSTIVINANKTDDFIEKLVKEWEVSSFNTPSQDTTPPPTSEQIFVSYASEDRDIVVKYILPILEELNKEKGYTFWFDQRKLRAADEWAHEIKSAIDKCNVFLTLHTANSYNVAYKDKQRYLRREWNTALEKQNEQRHVDPNYKFILPVIHGDQSVLWPSMESKQAINMYIDNFSNILKKRIVELIG